MATTPSIRTGSDGSLPSTSFGSMLSNRIRRANSSSISWGASIHRSSTLSSSQSAASLGHDATKDDSIRSKGGGKSEGSVFDQYEVTALLGGSDNSGVYSCKKKSKRTKDGEGNDFRTNLLRTFGKPEEGPNTIYNMKSLYISASSNNNTGADAFYQQLDRIKHLSHGNVVKMYEYFERYDRVYLITEHCPAGNLATRFPYSQCDTAKIVSQILAGAKYLHTNGMLHLSLNLENILFVDGNHRKMDCKIGNFGLSRKLKGRSHVSEGGEEKNYAAAPETFSASYLPQSDVWSVGVIAYILLVRQAPFRGDNIMEQLIRSRYDFDDPVWKKISKEAKDFISQCLELDPNKRPTAAQALNHPWLTRKVTLGAKDSSLTADEVADLKRVIQLTNFRRDAINMIAEVSSMEEIVNIAQWCFHFDEKKTGMSTFGELKLALQTNGYGVHELESIFGNNVENDIEDDDPLEFRDFLAAALEARGRFEEIILTETFERSFENEDSPMSDCELAGLLTSVGTPERVKELFPEADWKNGGKVSFMEFLDTYHWKSREYSSKIAMHLSHSMTTTMSVNCMMMLREPALLSSGVKYKKQGILGGSEVSAIYIVKVDPSFCVSGNGSRSLKQMRRGLHRRSFVQIEEEYALKVFQGTTSSVEFKLRKDISQLKHLNHKNIVKVFDEFVAHGKVHMVMETCLGGNLATRLPCSEAEAAKIIVKLLSALKYMHERGVVHSALSMETVLFDSGDDDAQVKLVNFGLSRKHLRHERVTREHEDDHSLYAASPESFRGVHSKKGDIWSIGVLAYYLITGLKPFRGKRWHQKLTNKELELDPNLLSKDAIAFINDLLSLDIRERPDARKAMCKIWIVKNGVLQHSPNRIREVGCTTDAEVLLRSEEFKRAAMNVMAQRLADDQIIELHESCERSGETEVAVSFGAFKNLLNKAGFDYIVEGIEKKSTFCQDGSLLLISFLEATLAARGHILEDFYQMSFTGTGGDSSYIDREQVLEMTESTGACVSVDAIFKKSGLRDDDEMIAFEEFVKVFRALRTREIIARLAGKDRRTMRMSMTSALSRATETIKHDLRHLGNNSKFRMVRRLGGTESIVFEVASKSPDDCETQNGDWSEDRDDADRERFVVKVFRLSRFPISVAKRMKSELIRDAMAIKAVRHPGIIEVHSVTEHFNQVHVRQRLCRGGNLGDRLPYSEAEAILIMKNVISAVDYLHRHKIVHRALSLENIMFLDEGETDIQLISFGLSRKCLSSDEMKQEDDDWSKTYALAPESLRDGVFSEKSDMWAIGVLAYTMLAGHLPFDGDCDQMREKVEFGAFSFDHPVWQGHSSTCQDFIYSLLDVNPSRRSDARKLSRHKWLRQTEVVPVPPLLEDEKCRAFKLLRKEMKFRQMATNTLAYHCTAPELLDLREELRHTSSSTRKGYTSYHEFGTALEECRISWFVIARILPSSEDYSAEFEYDSFLTQVIESRGNIIEVRLAEAFESMDAKDVSRREIEVLLGSVYEALQVDELFAQLQVQMDEDERISFQHFLRLFDRHVEWLSIQKHHGNSRFDIKNYREMSHSDSKLNTDTLEAISPPRSGSRRPSL